MSTHWGWYWNVKHRGYQRKKLCSNFEILDSFAMFQKHIVPHLYIGMVSLEIPSFDLKLILQDGYYEAQFSVASYKIPIENQKLHFGGYRYFFKCPKCYKRMRILYCVNAIFICRGCAKLGYYSQRLRPSQRCLYNSNKIKERLENAAGSLYVKPPWMKQKTFKYLKSKHFEYKEVNYPELLREELFKFYEDKL